MTNQMRYFFSAIVYTSLSSVIAFCAIFFVSPIGFVSAISFALFGTQFLIAIIFYLWYKKYSLLEIEFQNKVKQAKLLLDLREIALLDFYAKHGLSPRYNLDGSIMTPDEFLEYVVAIDENGNLKPLIYEILGIEPLIGPDGKEIPIVLVVKHLVGKFKSKDLNKLPFKKMTTKPVISEKGTVKLAVKKSEVAKAAFASKPTKKISIAYKFYSPTPLKASKYTPVKVEEKKNNAAKDSGKKAETETPAVSSKTDLKPKNTPKVEDGTLKKDIEVIKPKFVESGTKALEDKKIVNNIKNEKEESILKPDVEEVNNFADLTKGEWE